MSPPPDGVTAQSRWPCGTAIRTYSLYVGTPHQQNKPEQQQRVNVLFPNYGQNNVLWYK